MAPRITSPASTSITIPATQLRRTILRVTSSLAAVLALSACGSSGDTPPAQTNPDSDTSAESRLPAAFHATSDVFDYTSSDFTLLDPCEDIPVELRRHAGMEQYTSDTGFNTDSARACMSQSTASSSSSFLLGANNMKLEEFSTDTVLHQSGKYISDSKVHTFQMIDDQEDHCGVGTFYRRGHFVVIFYPGGFNGDELQIRNACTEAYRALVTLTNDRRFPS